MSEYRSLNPGNRKSPRLLLWAVVILLLLAALLFAARGGHLPEGAAKAESVQGLRGELAEARIDLKEVTDKLEVQRTRHAVDRRALELVRLEMATQKEYTSDLEEDLRFYKSLMSPEAVEPGLKVRSPELVAADSPGRYAFRIIVVQAARKHQLLQGSLSVQLNGILDDEEVSYDLAELAVGPLDAELELRFRYFQTIEGAFTVPGGFEPENMTIEASTRKPVKLEFREQFPWQLQEKFSHVGK